MPDINLNESDEVTIADAAGTNKLTVNSDGSINVAVVTKPLYAASITALATAATPTDIFTITGSATKTVRVYAVVMSATATTEAARDVLFIKRSTADSGGTSSTPTTIPLDSGDAAATAVVRAYTANPTLGTAVGTIYSYKIIAPTAAPGQPGNTTFIQNFASNIGRAVTLRGTSEQLVINLNSVTLTGNSFDISIFWTEE